MSYDDLTEIVPADPDSHFRLTECSCGSDHVAYVKMAIVRTTWAGKRRSAK